jgi:hypothetical protein
MICVIYAFRFHSARKSVTSDLLSEINGNIIVQVWRSFLNHTHLHPLWESGLQFTVLLLYMKAKAVPVHVMVAPEGRGGIAPTHS